MVAAVACANAGLLAQPAAVAYTGLTSAYAPAVYRSAYSPAVSTYVAQPAYSYAAAAPVYRSAVRFSTRLFFNKIKLQLNFILLLKFEICCFVFRQTEFWKLLH